MATAEATPTKEFSATTKDLGDKIVTLTLKQAKELSDYLEEVHGIKAGSGRSWRRGRGPG
jgi:large subunit ribosomal protein L7/L12